MKLSKYIIQVDEELANLFEEIGCTIYPIGDGTYYSIDEDAPQEAHDLAISAIEGYPDAVDEVRGFKVTKSSLPTSKNKTLAGQIRKMKE
jgi:hypothetical protein